MARYYYNKYNVTSYYAITSWVYVSSAYVGARGWVDYVLNPATGEITWVGEIVTLTTSGVVYLTIDEALWRRTQYPTYYDNHEAIISLLDSKGTLVQSNIAAENGTYPANGKHTDGYWYVRGSAIPIYTVKFVDWNGTVLKTQSVESGKSATAPSNPYRAGYTFSGWSGIYSNVKTNKTITATYTYIPVPPSTPSSITVPSTIKGGEDFAVSWGSGSGASSYYLERSVNGAVFISIYNGSALSKSESPLSTWNTVAYRVMSYNSDGYSSYRTSSTVTVKQFPEFKIRIDGTLKTSDNGWCRIDGVVRQIESIKTKLDGALKEV